jgi:hypothetical protein
MHRIKTIISRWVIAILIATGALTACGTRTHNEIKTINGIKMSCTWLTEAGDPWTKTDYRCYPLNGNQS